MCTQKYLCISTCVYCWIDGWMIHAEKNCFYFVVLIREKKGEKEDTNNVGERERRV